MVAVVPFAFLLATADDAISRPAATLFAAAAFTDFLDGWLARRSDHHSRFGRIVDPLADRALIDVALVLLVYHDRVPWWLAAPVLARDVVLAVLFRAARAGTRVHVNRAGKTATFAMMFALAALMVTSHDWPLAVYAAGLALSLTAALLYVRQVEGRLTSKPS
jgi:cardiolipin synthase (CMP-forming)